MRRSALGVPFSAASVDAVLVGRYAHAGSDNVKLPLNADLVVDGKVLESACAAHKFHDAAEVFSSF